jgi:hypothetical protein
MLLILMDHQIYQIKSLCQLLMQRLNITAEMVHAATEKHATPALLTAAHVHLAEVAEEEAVEAMWL